MLDSKGRVQNGTPLHRLQSLIAAGGLVLHPHAGDVLDTCTHLGDAADDSIAKLAEDATERIEKAERPGVAMAMRLSDLKHLVDVAINPPEAKVNNLAEENSTGEEEPTGERKPRGKKANSKKKPGEGAEGEQGDGSQA